MAEKKILVVGNKYLTHGSWYFHSSFLFFFYLLLIFFSFLFFLFLLFFSFWSRWLFVPNTRELGRDLFLPLRSTKTRKYSSLCDDGHALLEYCSSYYFNSNILKHKHIAITGSILLSND